MLYSSIPMWMLLYFSIYALMGIDYQTSTPL